MSDDLSDRERARMARRDKDAGAARRKTMDSGAAKHWHAVAEVEKKRGKAASGTLARLRGKP